MCAALPVELNQEEGREGGKALVLQRLGLAAQGCAEVVAHLLVCLPALQAGRQRHSGEHLLFLRPRVSKRSAPEGQDTRTAC